MAFLNDFRVSVQAFPQYSRHLEIRKSGRSIGTPLCIQTNNKRRRNGMPIYRDIGIVKTCCNGKSCSVFSLTARARASRLPRDFPASDALRLLVPVEMSQQDGP